MNKIPPKYYAKILLFGEYTLISGYRALIIPFSQFSGRLEFNRSYSCEHITSGESLKKYYDYLFNQIQNYPDGLELDLGKFNTDLGNGLYLDSDIPQGYGVGSSGVLVASVYKTYAKNPLLPEHGTNLVVLKRYFSFMESFFHGRSSGLDPLSCYVQRPLLVSSPNRIEIVNFPSEKNDKTYDIFLLDTGQTSKTEGLVQLFLNKTKNRHYRKVLVNEIIPRINICIDSILDGKIQNFIKEVFLLSALQLKYFPEMIPENFRNTWESGIISGDFSLKLCGSGGGGFILGFTTDFGKVQEFFTGKGKKVLHVY